VSSIVVGFMMMIGFRSDTIMGQFARKTAGNIEISKAVHLEGNYAFVNGLKMYYESHG
jgi:hypothetical protein